MTWVQHISGWLGRLSVGRKLTLIYLLDLTAVIYVSGILIHEKLQSIDFTQKEIVGAAYTTAVSEPLMDVFLGRGPLSDDQWQALDAVRAQHDDMLGTTEQGGAFAAALKASAADTQAPRDALLQQARTLLTTVGNQSNLILDPDLDSYYVMSLTLLRFPELLQVLHDTQRFVDRPAGASRGAVNRPAELLTLAGRLDATVIGIEADYTQAFVAGSPELRQALAPTREALRDAARGFQALVQEMAGNDGAAQDAQALRARYTVALTVLDRTWRTGVGELNRLLERRVQGLYSRMWLHLGTALALLACILSLVYLVAQQIAKPLRHLALVADDVRTSGDHTRRAEWNSRDEIGRLVTAFNGMLAQLDRERLLQQELAASARAAAAQRELVEAFPIPMVVTSVPEHEVLHANAPAQPWLNGRHNDPWRGGLEPGVRARFFQRLADNGAVDEFEVRWKGGTEPSWAVLSARRLQYQGRDAVLTAFTPINVLKVMEQRLELWAKVFEASSEGIVIMGADQKILSANKAFCRSTSYDFYEIVGEDLGFLLDETSTPHLGPAVARVLQEKESWQGEVRLRRRSGETYPAWLMISAVRDNSKGAVSNYIGICIDITDRKLNEERIQFLAHHDVLTELPNRSLCVQRLHEAITQARQSGELVAVLFIDLDRFKIINDTLGHHIGDGLLRSVAERLQQAVRNHDTVSRLGGDEFVIVMRNVASKDEVQHAVERRLIPLIRQIHPVDGHELSVSCSVGIAVYPEDGQAIDELMRRADAAMYEAKSTGRDMARFYSAETDQRALARQSVEHHLRRALDRGEFHVHYQPRVDATSQRLVGVEALLRWDSVTLGAVPPTEFIAIAEETGLIKPIGAWVLEQACAEWAAWQGLRLPDGEPHPLCGVSLSVNLSATQLADPQLVPLLQKVLQRHRMPAHSLELEITESQLMANASAAQAQIRELKALGLQLSIDDFGTGYSSLAYLKRFDIDKLKVDRSFVDDMVSDPADLAITRAVIALGHTLGLTVVAEGVENLATAQALQRLGCDELQGFYFSRPLPDDELQAWAQPRRLTSTMPTATPASASSSCSVSGSPSSSTPNSSANTGVRKVNEDIKVAG